MFTTTDQKVTHISEYFIVVGFNACKYNTQMKEEKIIKLISMFNENPMKCII